MAHFDIDKFFRVSTTTELPDGTRVSVRCLSDIELKARDTHSLSHVARMTEALKDPNSEDYRNKIQALDNATDASLVETLVMSWRDEWAREARDLLRVDFFPYPENATDLERVDVDRRQREHEQSVFTERAKYMINREMKFRETASGWDRDVLLRNIKQRAIGLYALDEGLQEQVYWTVWRSVELDGKTYWDSVDEVRQLTKTVIDRLTSVYREVDAQDPWALTKSESTRGFVGMGAEQSVGEREPVVPA